MTTISQLPAATAINSGDLFGITQESTGPGTGLGRKATAAMIRPSARLLLQWTSGAVVANGVGYFVVKAPYAGTVNSMAMATGNGSFNATVKINATDVTGLTTVAVNSSGISVVNATGANTFAVGDTLTVVVDSAASSPTDAMLELNVTWG